MEEPTESPSKIWYFLHLFLWIMTGLLCYMSWRKKNPAAAKKQLIHSVWIGLIIPGIVTIGVFATTLLTMA